MNALFDGIDPFYFIYVGISGLVFSLFFIIFFSYRRLRWALRKASHSRAIRPGLISSIRSLVMILLWTFLFAMILFMGSFLRAYQTFTHEEPVARITVMPVQQEQTVQIEIALREQDAFSSPQTYRVEGDQWMIEGDILKWSNWLNFLGLHTRYRLTRLRGRYLKTSDEINRQPTVFPLTAEESNPFWGALYEIGQTLPLVDTVYGNAAFQNAGKKKTYYVYVTNSGFSVRGVTDEDQN